jgi:hypothetical protein
MPIGYICETTNQIARELGYKRSTVSVYISRHPDEFEGLRLIDARLAVDDNRKALNCNYVEAEA